MGTLNDKLIFKNIYIKYLYFLYLIWICLRILFESINIVKKMPSAFSRERAFLFYYIILFVPAILGLL